MSDFLSQDQIDSLLSASVNENGNLDSVDSGGEEQSTAVDYQSLSDIFQIFNGQANQVLTTVLNREIKFEATSSEPAVVETVQETVPSPCLMITLNVTDAVVGTFFVFINTKDVAVVSDLMMMGDGSAAYIEDHKDAIGEIFNQIMGSFVTALGDRIGNTVASGTIDVNEFDYVSPSISFDDAEMVIESLSIEQIGETQCVIVLPRETCNSMMAAFGSGSGTADDELGLSSADVDDLTSMASDTGMAFEGAAVSSPSSKASHGNIDMLLDIELDVCIELGRTELAIKRILELAPGAIIELDRMAGEPVDLMVNNKVVAKGEVVVVDENFGIRIVSLVSPEERIKSLR